MEFGENDVVINYDSEHEQHNSLLENHSDPSFDEHASGHHHSDIACSKRKKLLERLKRWVIDVNLSRSGSFDTGYRDLDDATSSEGR